MSFATVHSKLTNLSHRGLAFEGGGVAGISHLGVVQYMDQIGLYTKFTHFTGSSVGSMMAALSACRVPMAKLEEIIMKIDFREFEDNSWGFFRDLYRLCNDFGWNRGESLRTIFETILQDCIKDPQITFAGVKERFGTTLVITGTHINKRETEYYTPETTPDLPIAEAVHRSSSIPLFFAAVRDGDRLIVDGGLLNNYPIRKLYDYLPKEQVIGSKLLTSAEIKREIVNPRNLTEYIKILVSMLHDQNIRVHVEDEDWARTIKVDVGTISATDFDITDDQKRVLIASGRNAANKFFI